VKIINGQGELMTAYARAGLKSKKRFGGALQPLISVDFRARTKPPAEMMYLEELQVRNDFQRLRENLAALSAASYIIELSEMNAHEGLENTALYNLLGNALLALETSQDYLRILCQFEVKLLALMGWLPETNNLGLKPEDQRVVNELLASMVRRESESAAPLSDYKALSRFFGKMIKTHLGERTPKSSRFLEFL